MDRERAIVMLFDTAVRCQCPAQSSGAGAIFDCPPSRIEGMGGPIQWKRGAAARSEAAASLLGVVLGAAILPAILAARITPATPPSQPNDGDQCLPAVEGTGL
jgi:hypothetical protein